MSLITYKKKRDFKKTPEPAGRRASAEHHQLHYVIQKHDASHLHYDFRLELDGTLKSWAVPKGPSLDPTRRVLAVQVEDHPLDYESFEGIIPTGQYGGGTVMLWDRGTWEPLDDPHEGLKRGKLRFALHGEKLHGAWSLIQMRGSAAANGKNWLLIKSRDDHSSTKNILEESPQSVSSKRTMEEISAQHPAVWNSNRHPSNGTTTKTTPNKNAALMPERISPQLAELAKQPPAGDQWVHEIKFDGYRLLAFLNHGDVSLRTRTNQDWTQKFAFFVPAFKKLIAQSAILDGEAIALDSEGRNGFQLLQASFKSKAKANLHYAAFDLLYLNGRDLRALPLLERKQLLKQLLDDSGAPAPIDYSDHVRGDSADIIRKACSLGSEGIVSKRADAPYVSQRGPSWIKSKCTKRQEFVIIGYTRSLKRADGLRSLLLGYHDGEHQLRYCGRVGTGFDAPLRRKILAALKKLEQPKPPTAEPPPRREQVNARWVAPALVCEIHFESWTRDAILRQPVFVGLRFDKPASEVQREIPIPTDNTNGSAKAKTTRRGVPPATKQSRPPRKTTPQWAGIQLTHPDKILYPQSALKKSDLADYYDLAAPFILPHIIERPLAVMRCPTGMNEKCFLMRNWVPSLPTAVDKIKVELGTHESHVLIHDAAGLLSLVQISTLEIHTWNFRAPDLLRPDQIVFDLDPAPNFPWKQTLRAARLLKDTLQGLGFTSFVKTSGGKGFHLTLPIKPTVNWEEVIAFAKTIAVYQSTPDLPFIANMRKDLRPGKIYLDYLRNGLGSTAVAPYSTRARESAAVSMPIAWEELDDLPSADHFTLKNAAEHLARRTADPWKNFEAARVDLLKIVKRHPAIKKE